MKCQRVKMGETFVPMSEDETIEVQNLLAEPKNDHVSVDGVLCFGKENSWKHTGIQDFSYGFESGLKRFCGGLDSNNAQGQDDLGLGVLDGLLDDIDEVDDIHAADDISGACEDFLLDVELAEKVSNLDCTPYEGSLLRNSGSESQSPGFSGSSNGPLGLSEMSTATVPEPECKNAPVVKAVICKLHDSCGAKCECQAPENCIFSTSHYLKNLDELDIDVKPLVSGMASDDGNKAVQTTRAGTLLRQKRLRKPTKRYIEEFSDPKSKHVMEKQQIPYAIAKDKCVKIRSDGKHHVRALTLEEPLTETITKETGEDIEELSNSKLACIIERQNIASAALKDKRMKVRSRNQLHSDRALKSAPREEPFIRATAQVPLQSRLPRGRQKKHVPISFPESDNEHTTSESEDDSVKKKLKKANDRRKHQRMWTLSEVMKLIEGISQYGTGRWTDIKKLLFSSSPYRTPIDLRDKWRNLLRASCANKKKQDRKEVEQKLKHSMRPLPKSVARQIRELSSIHPYPRFMPGGRYIRKKN